MTDIAKLCDRLESHEGYECPYDLLAEAATALREQAAIIRWKDTEISTMAEIARELISERAEAQAEIARLREALEVLLGKSGLGMMFSDRIKQAEAALGGKE